MSNNGNELVGVFFVMLAIVGFIVIVIQSVLETLGGSPVYWVGGGILALLTWRFRRIWWR